MRKILVIQHASGEGPGTLGDFLERMEIPMEIVRVYLGEKIPRSVKKFQGVISLGGPMSAYEEEKYPFLEEERILLRKAVDGDLPVLGICLGAQMIARACDGAVFRAPVPEKGWGTVDLTAKGRQDILFHGAPTEIPVVQWHEDTFEIPYDGMLLATSRDCTNQAFRVNNAYGLQFHIEVDQAMMSDWFREEREGEEWVRIFGEMETFYRSTAGQIFANFLNLLKICWVFGT